MKIDIVSVFPEYFEVLNLSLFGKAQAKGLVEVHAHNLRDWTHDVHHSVDDTPVGGGAGMVMKPEVWAECLDDLLGLAPVEVGTDTPAAAASSPAGVAPMLSESGDSFQCNVAYDGKTQESPDSDTTADATVLIFPNPSAPLFTQRDATELSRAGRLVFGCGRYEGYDARIPAYYRAQGVDVREYSIGDYVLNGGEVAVSVMLGPSPVCCPDSWAIRIPSWRSPIREATRCSNTASTRNRPPGGAWQSRTSCCPATTARWTASAATRPWPAPMRSARTSLSVSIAERSTRPTARR